MVNNIFLGLGSNKGDRIGFLQTAVDRIKDDPLSSIGKVSSVYESIPYGLKEQDNFLNAVIEISSERNLQELSLWIKKLEKEIGRVEGPRWGPREIDIDLLFYDNVVFSDPKLTVPHKEILLRDFVIVPLKEIAPGFQHPVTGQTMGSIDTGTVEELIIKKFATNLKS
jgi:2-amino-4-hydroxy-6-hydroxymethyldihydropteridine diphosphokinase